jgi:hypothetical protein
MRILRDITFNETEMATSMNMRNLLHETVTLIKFIEIIENTSDINNANTIFENAEDTPLKNITVEPAPVRRSIRHKKATFKAVGANAVGAAEAPIISADEEENEEEDYLPKAIIAKSTTTNEDKPTYEEAMANSEKFQWRESIDEEVKRIHEFDI